MEQLSNNSTSYEPIILEEGESVDYDSVLDRNTINMDWNGFIINSNSDEVVIASGDRGIIAVPSKFMPNSLKRVSSLGGGNVRSVNRCGDDAIWGLVKFPNGDDGEEQRLIKMDKNLCPKAGISLPISQDVFLV